MMGLRGGKFSRAALLASSSRMLTFSQPSGGSRAKNRFMQGDVPGLVPSSGELEQLSEIRMEFFWGFNFKWCVTISAAMDSKLGIILRAKRASAWRAA